MTSTFIWVSFIYLLGPFRTVEIKTNAYNDKIRQTPTGPDRARLAYLWAQGDSGITSGIDLGV